MEAVEREPGLASVLVNALDDDDGIVRMRAADALEKLTRDRPGLLAKHRRHLLDSMLRWEQQEIRWHVALMIPRMDLTTKQRVQAAERLKAYLEDPSIIVRTCAMEGLAELELGEPGTLPWVEPLIEELTMTGTAAMRARGRKLLARLRSS